MREASKAIQKFLSGFGAPAYEENSVPEDAVFPYCTYYPVQTDWDSTAMMPVRLWDYPGPDFSPDRIYGIVDRISAAVGEGIRLDAGPGKMVYLRKGSPWAQPQETPDVKARIIYLNLQITTFV